VLTGSTIKSRISVSPRTLAICLQQALVNPRCPEVLRPGGQPKKSSSWLNSANACSSVSRPYIRARADSKGLGSSSWAEVGDAAVDLQARFAALAVRAIQVQPSRMASSSPEGEASSSLISPTRMSVTLNQRRGEADQHRHQAVRRPVPARRSGPATRRIPRR